MVHTENDAKTVEKLINSYRCIRRVRGIGRMVSQNGPEQVPEGRRIVCHCLTVWVEHGIKDGGRAGVVGGIGISLDGRKGDDFLEGLSPAGIIKTSPNKV